MIYVSSSCVQEIQIRKSISRLVSLGYGNIELSGGTNYYANLEDDLQEIKRKFNLNFLLHNYFPPCADHFVANIASLNKKIFQATLDHYLKAIELSKVLQARKFGLHAGYLIDFKPNELGNALRKHNLACREEALGRMIEALDILKKAAGGEVILYLENNVLSKKNRIEFGNEIPFLLVSTNDHEELSSLTEFNMLFDLAHFKVSQNSLGKDFKLDCLSLLSTSNYIHLSGNNGIADQNNSLLQDSELIGLITKKILQDKTITLEVYDGEESISESYNFLQDLLNE